jgi:tricorn protease
LPRPVGFRLVREFSNMMRYARTTAAALVVLSSTALAAAQEPIRFGRTPDISPDGKTVVFSYLGDIWSVETIGGVARQLTTHVAHELYPVFSPDGGKIAFSSNRHGSYDIFVMSARGGPATRLTFDSAQDLVNGWSPDGKLILFSSTRSTAFPPSFELYTVPATGGRVRKVSAFEGKEGVFSPRGDQIAYVRGPGTWYRKGYRGSSNDDIWIASADGTNNRQLTDFNGQDNSPMWAPDGKTLYYVSERWGTPANIVRHDAAGKTRPSLVTFHKDDSVRQARVSANGEWIVYECGADLWVVSTHEGQRPRKLAIEVNADDKVNTEKTFTFSQGITEFVPSPDEQHIAFVVHGEIFLMPRTGGKATRLTDSPAYDHGIAWAPNGKQIVFLSDRYGHEDFFALESDPPDQKISASQRFRVKRLTDSADAKGGALFSPDGKRIAFLRAGKLWTMNPDGTDQKIIVNDTLVFDYDWSPDGEYFTFAREDGSLGSEIYVVKSSGGKATNVTRYATFNGDVSWSANGMKLAFISNRRQSTRMYVLDLQKPAVKGAPSTHEIDWEDIHLRARAPSEVGATSGTISPDGSKIAFRSFGSSGWDLWVASTDGKSNVRVTTGNVYPQIIRWSRGGTLLYFLDRHGLIHLARVGVTGEHVAIPFKAKMTVRRDELFREMFDQSWRALSDHFYDEKFHGADWKAVRTKYRELVKHVAMREDLYVLIRLMLGELNASHLGIGGPQQGPEEVTADLGLIFDESYRGPGLRVAEILKRGPADKRGIALKKGDYILSLDGVPLTEQANLSRLLGDKANETVVLEVADTPTPDPKKPSAIRKVELVATTREAVSNLMYERWVEHNAREVARLSKGKLGYIHIPSMDDDGLDRFVRALYSDNFDKEAIVLDVRYNGGGFTHDQVLNYLGAKEHTIFHQRNGGQGFVLRPYDRKWTRPLVLLINSRSYSDAEIFPNAFRTLGLGKLVGEPTGGHVIGTTAIRLIDGSQLRLPQIGVYTYRKVKDEIKKVNMEKEGVTPDFIVRPHPDQLARGEDAQLAKAVEVLKTDVIAWKKKRQESLASVHTGKPVAPDTGATGKPLVGPVNK